VASAARHRFTPLGFSTRILKAVSRCACHRTPNEVFALRKAAILLVCAPMAYDSFGDFVRALEGSGELIRIQQPIATD